MNLGDELRQKQEESFDRWFERWFEEQNFKKIFEQSAQKGYSGYRISCNEDKIPPTTEKKYEIRRLTDPRTLLKLKKKLPGIEIKYETERSTYFGGRMERIERYISFSWR